MKAYHSSCDEWHDPLEPCPNHVLPDPDPLTSPGADLEDERCLVCQQRARLIDGVCFDCEEHMCSMCGTPIPVGFAACGPCGNQRNQLELPSRD